jgi:hypothetical protein
VTPLVEGTVKLDGAGCEGAVSRAADVLALSAVDCAFV